MIRRFWPVLVASLVLLVAAIAYGWQTDRWASSPDLAAAAARLDNLPMKLGDWEAAIVEVPPEQIRAARASITARRYTHRYTRAEVTILVVCGRPGPVSVHSPDVCYRGAGFVMGPRHADAFCEGNTAWVADFKKEGPQLQTLRIRWAWSDGTNWTASNLPRVEFARAPVLYKLYVVRAIAPTGDKTSSAETEFLNEFLPALQTVLNPHV